MSKKVLITGSREFDNGLMVLAALEAERVSGERLILINGGARGADTIAATLGDSMPGVLVATMPADWRNDGRYEGGPIRNSAMLELNPDVVLAFYKTGAANKGTQNTVDQATALGIPVKTFTA